MSSGAFKSWIAKALTAQVAAAEHIRDCDRCRHLFGIAYDETNQAENRALNFPEKWGGAPSPLNVSVQILRELRDCPDWPKGS
jgi:hypothetical protein